MNDNNVFEKLGEVIGGVSEAMKDSKSFFLCPNCSHKDVCKKRDKPDRQCNDFMDATTFKQYASIYHFFQPIFDWLKFHYPAGEVKFIVDGTSAKMVLEHGPSVFSKEITEPISYLNQIGETKEDKPGTNE